MTRKGLPGHAVYNKVRNAFELQEILLACKTRLKWGLEDAIRAGFNENELVQAGYTDSDSSSGEQQQQQQQQQQQDEEGNMTVEGGTTKTSTRENATATETGTGNTTGGGSRETSAQSSATPLSEQGASRMTSRDDSQGS